MSLLSACRRENIVKRTLKELIDAAENIRQYGIEDAGETLDEVLYTFNKVFLLIERFVNESGNIALECGSEWMFQSDSGQVSGLELAGNILDKLEDYAEPEEE